MSDDKKYEEHTVLLNKISDQVTEQTKVIANLDKKVDLNIQKVQYELEKIHTLDEQQNQLIDKHIAGVNTLRAMHEDAAFEANLSMTFGRQGRTGLAEQLQALAEAAPEDVNPNAAFDKPVGGEQ